MEAKSLHCALRISATKRGSFDGTYIGVEHAIHPENFGFTDRPFRPDVMDNTNARLVLFVRVVRIPLRGERTHCRAVGIAGALVHCGQTYSVAFRSSVRRSSDETPAITPAFGYQSIEPT
jgi:hypothetical protein